ncbi:unnamed protein product [Prunus brigantina]
MPKVLPPLGLLLILLEMVLISRQSKFAASSTHLPRRIWTKTFSTFVRRHSFWVPTGLARCQRKWSICSRRMLRLPFASKALLPWLLTPGSQSVNRDENLLAAALCFWNSASNTFDFRLGPATPTLLDMAQIFGFRPHERHVDAVGDYHRRKNKERLAKSFTISPTTINQNYSFPNYLKKFSTENDKDQQHMLFLLYWLNMFPGYRLFAKELEDEEVRTDSGRSS